MHLYYHDQIGGGIDVSAHFDAQQLAILGQIDTLFDRYSNPESLKFWQFFDEGHAHEWDWIRQLAVEFLEKSKK